MIKPASTWDEWPKWDDETSFRTPRFRFSCAAGDYSRRTNADKVALIKDRELIDIYRGLVLNQPIRTVFEIGFFQGGMPLLLADMIALEKFVGIDWNPPTADLQGLIDRSGLSSSIALIGNVDQDDTSRIRSILDEQFGSQPLDLIIDDCSHECARSRVCFEALFGYLRPGGLYVIEDWGWTHWPGGRFQTDASQFHGKESMTNLIFEMTMALASNWRIISRVDIASHTCVIVTRGDALPHKALLDLRGMTNVAGGRQAKLII
jgi:hypothetical protein